MIGWLRGLTLTAVALVIALLASGCGGARVNALPQQPGLPAISADPANAPVGAAAGSTSSVCPTDESGSS